MLLFTGARMSQVDFVVAMTIIHIANH